MSTLGDIGNFASGIVHDVTSIIKTARAPATIPAYGIYGGPPVPYSPNANPALSSANAYAPAGIPQNPLLAPSSSTLLILGAVGLLFLAFVMSTKGR